MMTRELLESSRCVREAAGGLRAKLGAGVIVPGAEAGPGGVVGAALRAVYDRTVEERLPPQFVPLLRKLGGEGE